MTSLIRTVKRESANENIHTNGEPVWKTFGRALSEEAQNPQ